MHDLHGHEHGTGRSGEASIGVVFCGYNEIQERRRKNVLIDYVKLQKYVGASSYEQLKTSHKGWVEEYLGTGETSRQEEWTSSIAVGSKVFVENVKVVLGLGAKGRAVIEGDETYHLRDGAVRYEVLFRAENDDIALENTYSWAVNIDKSKT
jgi:hypothetical protein